MNEVIQAILNGIRNVPYSYLEIHYEKTAGDNTHQLILSSCGLSLRLLVVDVVKPNCFLFQSSLANLFWLILFIWS